MTTPASFVPASFRRLLILAGVLAPLMIPGFAAATQCDADCEGPDCYGGCTVNSITCSTACVADTCPGTATCKEYGDHTQCFHEFTGECEADTGGPPEGPEQPYLRTASGVARGAEWAVISYPSTDFSSPQRQAVEVLAATSLFYAEHTVDALLVDRRRETASLRQRFHAEGHRLPDLPVQRRVRYAVDPNTACVRSRLELASRTLPDGVPDRATAFFRATVGEGGQIVAVEVLHSLTPEATAPLAAFLKENSNVRRLDGNRGPFQAYVVLYSDGGTASWIVSGARDLL